MTVVSKIVCGEVRRKCSINLLTHRNALGSGHLGPYSVSSGWRRCLHSQASHWMDRSAVAMPACDTQRVGPDVVLPATSPAAVNHDGVVQLRMGEGLGSRPPVSCYTCFQTTVEKVPGNTALVSGDRSWNYEEYFKEINLVAKAFIELGLQPHRTVAILGNNSPEWFCSAVGAVFAGGITTGVYTSNTPDAVFYQLKHSKANIAVVEDDCQLQKVLAYREELPELQAIVEYGDMPGQDGVLSWKQLLDIGRSVDDHELDSRLRGQAVNQPAVICYTSGTTAKPKGALLSQDNLTWCCASAEQTYNLQFGHEVMISYLPLAHIVAHVSDVWMIPSVGGTIHFADRDALRGTLLNTLAQVHPTRFVAVPRVFEKMHSQLESVLSSYTGPKGMLLDWARSVATNHFDSILAGGNGCGIKYKLVNQLLLSKIHAKLGLDRCLNGLYSGSAPLSADTIQFLKSVGLVVSEIYGMTENPNHTANYFHVVKKGERIRQGSVGRSAAGCQTRLHLEDPVDGIGEVAANGRNVFMGYLSDSTRTRETFDRGFWLLTGDLATMEDGFVTIKGRIKDVIITSGGKNIAPYPIESMIKSLLPDLVSNCIVVGDKQKHLACLLTIRAVLDPETLEITDQLEACAWEFCKMHGHEPASVSDLAARKDEYDGVYDAILSVMEKVNKASASKAAKIRKFTVLPKDFSISGGELGPTMKMKRHAIEEKYKTEIAHMYATSDRTSLWDA